MQQNPLDPYGDRFNPILEGSGGGNRFLGGSGGGVVYMEVVTQLLLDGEISSNGEGPKQMND